MPWFERTLDDSAKQAPQRPGGIPGGGRYLEFVQQCGGRPRYPKVIEQHLHRELPFYGDGRLMMDAVKRGADRQQLHEHIRVRSHGRFQGCERRGRGERLACAHHRVRRTLDKLHTIVSPEKYVGCAPMQTEEFIWELHPSYFGQICVCANGKGRD